MGVGKELLKKSGKKVIDASAAVAGGALHATGSAASGIGRGVTETGKGLEEGLVETGKGVGYLAHGAGYVVKGSGRLVRGLAKKVAEAGTDYVNIPKKDFEMLLYLEPDKQVKALQVYLARSIKKDYVKIPTEDIREALEHLTYSKDRKKHSPLDDIVYKAAAVILILIGASIVLSTEATITTYSVVPEDSNQARFFIIGMGLIALGIFFPSLAFFKKFIEKSKNKYSAIAKKKKKNKK